MYATWRAAAEAINAAVPDMAVSLSDMGEAPGPLGAGLPAWAMKLLGDAFLLPKATLEWIKSATTLFYTWHWPGGPSGNPDWMDRAVNLSKAWGMPL